MVATEAATSSSSLDKLELAGMSSITGTVELPGSKSLSNRVLLLASLSEGSTKIENLLESQDVMHMEMALKELFVELKVDGKTAVVEGSDGHYIIRNIGLFLGNAGTAMRPLTAALAMQKGPGAYVLDGTPRMQERPIGDLADALVSLGCDVRVSDTRCPPVYITTQPEGIAGGKCQVRGDISSQYLSALLMAAPLANGDITIEVIGDLVSVPYVKMTVGLMKQFGVQVETTESYNQFIIRDGQKYKAPSGIHYVEGDASSASYFLAAAAISGGPVTVRGCGTTSVQGDVRFAKVLEMMGAEVLWTDNSITCKGSGKLKGVDVDCGDIPDAAMSLATTALFAEGPTAIRNVYNWRVKETERMKAIVTELRKLGAEVEEGRDYCVITPPSKVTPGVEIETYDDHRMAMAFSLVAAGGVPVTILDPKVTAKTYPEYFTEFQRIGK